MSYYELTSESINMNKGRVFRIQALQDIPNHHVKKGDFGGFMDKKSILQGNAWISGDSIVLNSILKDEVLVGGESIILNCSLFGRCFIQNSSRVINVAGNGIFAVGEVSIINSTLSTEKQDCLVFLIEGNAIINDCGILYTGNGQKPIVVKDDAQLERCLVEGSHMEFNKHSAIRFSEVKGKNMLFENMKEVSYTKIKGNEMEFNRVPSITESTIRGKKLLVKGGITIRDSKIKAMNMEMYGTDILIDDSIIIGKNIYIRDYVNIKFVDIQGDDVFLSNYASLVGKESEPIKLLGNVQIREFVQFAIEEGRKSNVLSNEEIDGDFVHTGN